MCTQGLGAVCVHVRKSIYALRWVFTRGCYMGSVDTGVCVEVCMLACVRNVFVSIYCLFFSIKLLLSHCTQYD